MDGSGKRAVEPFDEKDVKHPFLEVSEFEVMFPKQREAYIKDVEQYLKKAIEKNKLKFKANYASSLLTVSTTERTRDPYAILSGRDVLKLVSRGVPLDKALRVFEDGITCDIVQINNLAANKDLFIKRRERLLGPYGNTLKAIELLTSSCVVVYGNTVSSIGQHKDLKEVRRIVLGCMNNIHPIYEVKRLMVKKELEKDPLLKNESWERYLPKYKKTHSKKAKASSKGSTPGKEKPLFPDPPQKRKVDLAMETGEYFLEKSSRGKSGKRRGSPAPVAEAQKTEK